MTNFEKYSSEPQEAWDAYISQTDGKLISQIDKENSAKTNCEIRKYNQSAGFAFWLMCNHKRYLEKGL